LEELPSSSVVLIVLHEAGIVVPSIINLQNILDTLAPSEAIWYLEETDIVLIGAVTHTFGVTAEVLHSVLLDENSKFFMESGSRIDIFLN